MKKCASARGSISEYRAVGLLLSCGSSLNEFGSAASSCTACSAWCGIRLGECMPTCETCLPMRSASRWSGPSHMETQCQGKVSFAQEGVRSSIENDTDTSSWAHLYVFSMIFVNSAISHQRLELIAAHARSCWSLRRVQAPEYGDRFAAPTLPRACWLMTRTPLMARG